MAATPIGPLRGPIPLGLPRRDPPESDYRYAAKVAADIERFEIEDAARSPQPEQPPELESNDISVLDIEAQPVVRPPLSGEQVYLRSLSDRELARQVKAA